MKREDRKRQRDEEEELAAALALEVLASGAGEVVVEGEGEERPAKRIAVEGEVKEDTMMVDGAIASTSTLPPLVISVEAVDPALKKEASGTSTPRSRVASPPPPPHFSGPKVYTFKASGQLRGHTSYLTFAVLLPLSPPTEKAEAIIEAADPVVI